MAQTDSGKWGRLSALEPCVRGEQLCRVGPLANAFPLDQRSLGLRALWLGRGGLVAQARR